MPGKELSRWTLTWFASAMVFLLAALAAAVLLPIDDWAEGRALALVHLFALGWLGQMILGALLQFVPVLAARPLALPRLALPTLLLAASGTIALAAGFMALEGWAPGLALLAIAPMLLALAFALALAMLLPALIRAVGPRDNARRMVLLALTCLPLVWLSGSGMVAELLGQGIGIALLPDALPLHVLLALGGWFGLVSFGVGYRLYAMFLLAAEREGALRRATFHAALAMLVAILAGGLMLSTDRLPWLWPVLGAAAVAALCHMADFRHLWHSRKRAATEPNMQMTPAAFGFLALALLLALPATRQGGAWAEAAAFAALAGWLSLLTLAQMLKIVSFLTWIQVFAPRIGRMKVPMVQDLTDGHAMRRGLWLWTLGAGAGTLALLARQPVAFRAAAAVLLLAALLIARELLAIRRLRHLPADLRPAAPPLFLPSQDRSLRHDQAHDPIPRLDPRA